MKKLMIAAAAAAMVGGVFADALVYDLKITGKKAVAANGYVQMYGAYPVFDNQGNLKNVKEGWHKFSDWNNNGKWAAVKVCYRKSASFTWAGVVAGCDCNDGTATGPFDNMIDKDGNPAIIAAVWEAKVKSELNVGFALANFIRSGAKTDFVEAMIAMDVNDADGNQIGGLTLVGQGKYDAKKGYLTSVNGNFVGEIGIDSIQSAKDCTVCDSAASNTCYPYDLVLCEDPAGKQLDLSAENTWANQTCFAYGTWSLKYNASKSKKMMKLDTVIDKDTGKEIFEAEKIEKALGFPKYVKTIDFEIDTSNNP